MTAAGFALHTWTLDTTPLAEVLRVVRATGWDAIELRRLDFARAAQAGQPAEAVLDLVRASGLPVACVGVELGWMLAAGAERHRLLEAFAESCRWAAALGSHTVMSPVDRDAGDLDRAVASIREVGDLAAARGVRLAIEFNSQVTQFNTPGRLRDALARAGHSHVGLLLDSYHLERSGTWRELSDVGADEIAYVQYSDVPREGCEPGKTTDRLAPGQGRVPFAEFFRFLAARGYRGYLSYEAPNPAAWSRDAAAVAGEALTATRALVGSSA